MLHFDSSPETMAAARIGKQLRVALNQAGPVAVELRALVDALCGRLTPHSAAAPMELWRLAQGLHYGGALDADALAQLETELTALCPIWINR